MWEGPAQPVAILCVLPFIPQGTLSPVLGLTLSCKQSPAGAASHSAPKLPGNHQEFIHMWEGPAQPVAINPNQPNTTKKTSRICF